MNTSHLLARMRIAMASTLLMVLTACEKDITPCFTSSSTNVTTGQVVTFQDCSKGDGFLDESEPATWKWSFGDGASQQGSGFASHAYSAPGTYTVTLEVDDDDGDAKGTTSQTIVVTQAQGHLTFWTPINQPNIQVTVNGTTQYISGWWTVQPPCGGQYCANFTLDAGNYTWSAQGAGGAFFGFGSGTITVSAGECERIQL